MGRQEASRGGGDEGSEEPTTLTRTYPVKTRVRYEAAIEVAFISNARFAWCSWSTGSLSDSRPSNDTIDSSYQRFVRHVNTIPSAANRIYPIDFHIRSSFVAQDLENKSLFPFPSSANKRERISRWTATGGSIMNSKSEQTRWKAMLRPAAPGRIVARV